MDDSRIVQLYWERDEEALRQTERKYGNDCRILAKRFLCSDADAEEVVNDTWLRAWNSIPPQKPAVLRMFLAKITRNLAMNRCRDQNAQKRGGGERILALEELSECVPARVAVEEELEAKELARVIQKFLRTQSDRDRSIFVRRYFSLESIEEIAGRYGLTEVNTRKILSRTRSKLKDYLTKEGYAI